MNHIVFGGRGFIGQNLCEQLINDGHTVVSVDSNVWGIDYSTKLHNSGNKFYEATFDIVIQQKEIRDFVNDLRFNPEDCTVWHLAANSDIRAGTESIEVDLKDTFLTSVKIIDFCKAFNYKKICFASSSAVYGNWAEPDHKYVETDMTQPISNYGAMKLASEAILRSASESYFQSVEVFRFPNVIGRPSTHGVILDFVNKLKSNPGVLNVLGDGQQNKPYLHVSALVDAMIFLTSIKTNEKFQITNIGQNGSNVSVRQIAELVVRELAPGSDIQYGTSKGGWIGDVPRVSFNNDKLENLGWKSQLTGVDAVLRTIQEIRFDLA